MKIEHYHLGNHTEYRLLNTQTGDYACIIPSYGGIIRKLVLKQTTVVLVTEYPNELEGTLGYPSALMFPFASRIKNGQYTFEGISYQLPINEPARNNAIHGFMAHRVFTVSAQETNAQQAILTISYPYQGDYQGYPFPFELSITYTFDANGTLHISYGVTNTGTKAMPMALGWHPYFQFDEESINDLQIAIPSDKIVMFDQQMMPTHTQPFEQPSDEWLSINNRVLDNVFLLSPSANGQQTRLHSATKNLTLTLWQETGKEKYNYLVVYTPPARKTIAIEPITNNVNAFNTGDGLIVLSPHNSIKVACSVRVD
jgi:aldose 1-epimerase